MSNQEAKLHYIQSKYKLLRDFKTPITDEIASRIEELYPNEIAIDNYVKDLIMRRLENFSKSSL